MRKILVSLSIIGAVAAIATGVTIAFFQDTETSTGNTFTAGTLDLKVGDADEGFGNGVSATWVMPNMIPGVTAVGPLSVNLQNSGTIAANHVEISFSHSIDEATNPVESDSNPSSTPGEMARWIEIIGMTYNGVNLVSAPYTDANGNGFFDLEDVTLPPYTSVGGPLDNLVPPNPNGAGSRTLTMELRFNAGATNDIQGDILTTTVTFTLNQDSSQ
jgi:predicted ribosomally synthesized peptide with SipW-like signal peptide